MRTIIDQSRVRRNRARALADNTDGADFLLLRALDDLKDRLGAVKRSFGRALCVGPVSDQVAQWVLAEKLADSVVHFGALGLNDDEVIDPSLVGDDPKFDLVITLFLLHETNDTPGILYQLKRMMAPDGLLMGCCMGAGTLAQLRDSLLHAETQLRGGAGARVLPFMDVRAAGALLQRTGFAMPVVDGEEIIVRYGNIGGLLADLRAMGATNSLAEQPNGILTPGLLARAQDHYLAHHADGDGRLRATFSLIWLSGWAPADHQPKPLKPGSATISLASVLKPRT